MNNLKVALEKRLWKKRIYIEKFSRNKGRADERVGLSAGEY